MKTTFPTLWLITVLVSLAGPNGMAGTTSGQSLELELIPFPAPEATYEIIARFTNHSAEPVVIFRPLDGSFYCWIMPYYKFTIAGPDGELVELGGRCGVYGPWGDTAWPDDYRIEIAPAQSYDLLLGMPHLIPALAEYKVYVEYTFKESKRHDSRITPVPEAWNGTVKSTTIVATLAPYRSERPRTDADIDALEKLQEVTYIDASFSEITDAGLKSLAGLDRLKGLNLRGTRITDAGLAILPSIKNLRSLNLSSTEVSDSGLRHLSDMASMRSLKLDRTKISRHGLRFLSKLTDLTELGLYQTEIDDAGLAHLKDMKMLKTLSLGVTAVTDAGLIHLKDLPNLDYLSVADTKVTPAGVARFKQARPKVEVWYP